jgi:outer membrane protein OmpA-like peptidoglycan-associated protein
MEGTMFCRPMNSRLILAATVLTCGVTVSLFPAHAGDVSAQQIREQLAAPKTRGLSATRPSVNAEDLATIKRISQSRSLSAADREQMAAIAAKRPSIDLEINFDYNSAAVTARTAPQLNNLGEALTSSDLRDSIVMLAGHTDAKGSDGYNQGLSERRSETVKKYLIERYRIPADRLVAVGYGETRLKNPSDPNGAENRRVQIVNMAEQNQATK